MALARLLLLLAVVIWGWTFVATKICLAYMSAIELLGLRLILALPTLLVILRLRGVHMPGRSHAPRLLLGGALIGGHFLIQITGIRYTSATNTGWIIAVTPLVIALLARILLGERLGLGTLGGIAVSATGVVLLVSRGDPASIGRLSTIGDWLVLASAFTWALYTIATRDVVRTVHPLAVTFGVLLTAAVPVLLAVLFTTEWSRILRLPVEVIVALLYLGIPGMALAQWFWQEGVSRIGAARAGTFLFLEPLATTALAVPYLGEPFGPFTLIGGGLVLLGVRLSQRTERPPRAPGKTDALLSGLE
jgi:drug/metabolite transporter (DMT)-like permease